MKVEVLPVEILGLPEWADDVRLRLTGVLEELKASIANYGFTVPITVVRSGEGTYVVVDGITRLMAARELGIDHVPAIVLRAEKDDEVSLFRLALRLNIAQAGMGPVSRLRAVAYLVRKGWTIERACSEVGVSPSWFRTYRPILELPRELQEQVERGEVSLNEALRLKGAQADMLTSVADAYSASRASSGGKRSERTLECFICGKPIKARDRAWRPFHRSCLEILDTILEECLRIERTENHITAYCRRCNAPLFAADWDGVRWTVSTTLEEREEG